MNIIVTTLKKVRKKLTAFRNTENECVTLQDGRVVYLSRSMAVCVILKHRGKYLVTQRSHEMDDEKGKWCFPCGYLDYDEDIYQAASRELYEETGCYIHSNIFLLSGCSIQSDPTRDARQNVTFRFIIDADKMINDFSPEFSIDNKEVIGIAMVDGEEDLEYAFNHREILDSLIRRN